MPDTAPQPPPLSRWVWLLVLAKVALHLVDHPAYGYFRDELYYIACSDHLAWGYVDHPPLSIAILAATRAVLGDGMLAIRIPVIISGALTVLLTGVLARELGGGPFAQFLAALGCLLMGFGLGVDTFFSMNAFEVLFWLAAALIVARFINTRDERLWIAFGILVGIGLLNKISMSFLAAGIVIGLALTPLRPQLLSPWLWSGGAVSALIFLPHVLWQAHNGWPTLEFMHNATTMKIRAMSIGEFIGAQLLYTNPGTLPVWLAGLLYFLVGRTGKAYRVLAIAYLAIFILLIAQHAKAYYLAPAYPIFTAGGGVALARATSTRWRRWLRPVIVIALLVLGGAAVPMAIPMLAPDATARYAQAIGIDAPQEERHQRVALSQHLADRFGWENLVVTVARAYGALPSEERANASIFANNYGEAGAIDFFGPRYGLPKAISAHNNYWLWGPGTATGAVVISVGVPRDRLDALFTDVTQVDTIVSPYAVAYETDLPVYVCRGLKRPLRELWPQLKGFV